MQDRTNTDEVVTIKKKTTMEFFWSELLIYVSQIFVFFLVAALVSRTLTDESRLTAFLSGKVNENSVSEIGYIIIATITTLGIICMVERAIPPTNWWSELADEVLESFGRTIYFFGSSVTGALIATALFINNNPSVKAQEPKFWLVMASIFGIGAFLYGFGASYIFKRKKYIKSSNKASQPTPKSGAAEL